MTARAPAGFRHLPLRVAAISTLLVAGLGLVLGVAIVLILQANLVGGIDLRLAAELAAVRSHQDLDRLLSGQDVPGEFGEEAESGRFEAPFLVWAVGGDGRVVGSDPTATLPAALTHASGPLGATVAGTEMRLAGGPLGSGWLVVGQTTSEVATARNNVIVAEALIAPLLLALVFLGALAVGRRVAGPIERARRQQLDFAADASHELRTPLTVIEAETSLALRSPRDPVADGATFGRVREESHHLRRLVDDLLWLARFDAAPSPPDSAPLDLGALATTAAERFRAVAEQHGLKLTTRVTGTTSPILAAPAEWLARLLSVLLDNAVTYSPAGASVTVLVTSEPGRVELAVEDSGPGIPPEERERVLDRFHRVSEAPGGAGLGLAIADAIVRGTGGRWEIGRAAAGGARMAVAWPRRAGGAYEARSVEQMATEGTPPAGPEPGA